MTSLTAAVRIPRIRRLRKPPALIVYYLSWYGLMLLMAGETIYSTLHAEIFQIAVSAFCFTIYASLSLAWRHLFLRALRDWQDGRPIRNVLLLEWAVLCTQILVTMITLVTL